MRGSTRAASAKVAGEADPPPRRPRHADSSSSRLGEPRAPAVRGHRSQKSLQAATISDVGRPETSRALNGDVFRPHLALLAAIALILSAVSGEASVVAALHLVSGEARAFSSGSPTRATAPLGDAVPAPSGQQHPPERVSAFAARMSVQPELLREGLEGLEQIYRREYGTAEATFRRLSAQYPSSGIGPFGLVMLYQSQMGERMDFGQDKPYTAAFEEAVKRLDVAVDRREAEAWNRFLRGCAKGVNSLYLYRKDRVLAALYDGLSAMNDIEEARKLDPQFKDPYIGVGVYDYWRSAATLRYKQLPFFPDKRDQGLEELVIARDQGIITPTLARLALAWSYLDRKLYRAGMAEAEALTRRYPNSVLSHQIAGHLYARNQQVPGAIAAYEQVLKIDPSNTNVCYYLGMLYLHRVHEPVRASRYLEKYLAGTPDEQTIAIGRTRLGDAYWLQGREAEAQTQWKMALAADPDHRLARLRAEGSRPVARKKRVHKVGEGNPNNPRLMKVRQEELRRAGVLGQSAPSTAPGTASSGAAAPASSGPPPAAAPSSGTPPPAAPPGGK